MSALLIRYVSEQFAHAKLARGRLVPAIPELYTHLEISAVQFTPQTLHYPITYSLYNVGIVANDERTMSLAHTICALISNVVIVSATEKSLNYLLAPGQIVSEKGNVQDKMAALVGVTEDGNASSPIIENLDSFSRILQSQNIQKPQLVSLYPFVTSYQLPQSNPMQQSSIQSSSLRQVHSFYPAMQSLL